MKKLTQENKMAIWEFISLIFTLLMSFLLHFAFQWSNSNTFIGVFSPINESVWEHSKLLFFPFLIFSIVEYLVLKPNFSNYVVAKAVPLVFAIPAMITIFYTYTGILGFHNVYVDIALSVGIVIWMNWYSYKFQKSKSSGDGYLIFLSITVIIFILITIFTFYPPNIPLFVSSN